MDMSQAENLLNEALAAFDFGGELVGAVRYGSGHINDTFVVHTQPGEDPCRRFILQRISSAAFKHPEEVMANIVGVTSYLGRMIREAGGDPERETMSVWATRDGKNFYTDSEGGAWRVYPFVEGTVCLQKAETPELFAASARAFGKFQRMLRDYPADTLYETIPKFHDTEDRLAKLKAAVAADVMGRVKEVGPELKFVAEREADCSVALSALREGRLPLRVTHNDTKLNNILIDRATGEGICVIDLDTVMPGFVLSDIGDFIRTGANTGAEDDENLDNVNVNIDIFKAYTRGYMEKVKSFLTPMEIKLLPYGGRLLTYMQTVRFLTDYINGDTYYKIRSPKHNLIRTKAQFKLLQSLEAHADEMDAFMSEWL